LIEVPELTFFWQYPEYWAEKEPNLAAISFKKKVITAKELNDQTDQLGKAFINLGVKKGDTIVTILPTNPEFILTYIAASKIGAITIPMDIKYKKADFELLIPQSSPKVIVAVNKFEKNRVGELLEELKPKFGDIKYVMVKNAKFGIPFEELLEKKYELDIELKEAKENQDEDDPILVIWTGGTTGVPKAALLSHRNVVSTIIAEFKKFVEFSRAEEKFKMIVNFPVSHVGGTVEILGSSIVGGLEMIVRESWSPYDTLKYTKEEKIPILGGVPTMFNIFLSMSDLDTYELKEFVKFVFLSGEKVGLDFLENIKEHISENIVIGYGSTEAGSEVTMTELGDDYVKIAEGYVGKPLEGMKVIIADEKGNSLPPMKTGEVLVRGPMAIKSYYKMPEEDKAGFTSDGWCKTGDLGYLNEEGGLYITGRIKQIIRVGAYTVLPTEIEEVVLRDKRLLFAAAIPYPDKILGEVVWLVVVPDLGKKITEEEVLKRCEEQLAKFKVPRKIIIYPLDPKDPPVTRIGKIDRIRLKKELFPPEV